MRRSHITGLALAIAAAACGIGVARADEVTIASAGPLSGPQAFFGVTWQNGMQLYLDEVNKSGGVNGHTFKFMKMDDQADPRQGTLVAQKLCDDDSVKVVLGHFNSGVVLPTLPIYSQCDMPDIIFGSNPALTQQGVANIVRPVPNDFIQGALPANYARNDMKAERAAVVNDKQTFGEGVSRIFAERFKQAGGTVTSVSQVNPTDVDFTALITQLKQQNPQVVYLGAVMPQLALFAKQMHDLGLDAKLFVPDGGYTPDLPKQAGDAAAQAIYVTFQVPPYDSSPELVDFTKRYTAAFHSDPGAYSVYGYILAQIAVAAIKSAPKLDRADIVSALHSTKLDTILGPVSFDKNGDLAGGGRVFLYHIDNGKFVLAGHS
ncbi:MAG TPA: branched-chain amino acid ABC transporter substrate-binding protein [Acetobacteraceae bacterium]